MYNFNKAITNFIFKLETLKTYIIHKMNRNVFENRMLITLIIILRLFRGFYSRIDKQNLFKFFTIAMLNYLLMLDGTIMKPINLIGGILGPF